MRKLGLLSLVVLPLVLAGCERASDPEANPQITAKDVLAVAGLIVVVVAAVWIETRWALPAAKRARGKKWLRNLKRW